MMTYEIQSKELLQALHLLTRDGKLNQDASRKLKQIHHLFQFIEPLLNESLQKYQSLNLVDHGAGKSYLGFILYDLYFKRIESGKIFGVETRNDLIEKSQALASKLNFKRMDFLNLSVNDSTTSPLIPKEIEIVTALHACDTATDDAIKFGLQKKAKYMVLIPCCQAEVASILRKHKNKSFSKTPISELWRHPLHTREIGSNLTNVLRCLLLESNGYSVTVTEFTGLEHSMKNELIIAKHTGVVRKNARERANAIIDTFNLRDLESRFLY